jgi:hypothetical protein
MNGSKHPRWNNRIVSTGGYLKIRVGKSHPLADSKGYAYEHDLIFIAAIGYSSIGLSINCTLHHRNGDRLDNRLSNLQLLPNSEHHRLHAAQQRRDKQGRFARGRKL